MKVVLMAGGKGTRIASITSDLPKPLIPVCGKPVLEREICSLRDQGFTEIILTVSHMGQKIIDYFGDGHALGVSIEYFLEETPLGNAGALYHLRDRLTEDFLLLNADAMFDVDFNRFVSAHKTHGCLATLFTHPNSHPYDSGLIVADSDGMVRQWLSKEDSRPRWYRNRVNAGLHVISPAILDRFTPSGRVDLDRDLLKPLAGTGTLYCYDSTEYVKDMGTPERYYQVCRDFGSGLVERKSLRQPQKAIFLDRDGTLNRYVGFLTSADQLELLPDVPAAVKKINESGYLAIVITNQPVIARGEVTLDQLEQIHNKLETLLGQEGAYLDGIYYCPHHPHGGYPGEVAELKIDCDCRKPKPGLLLRAAEEFRINLQESYFIGDSTRDVEAGHAAGCHTILIEKDGSLLEAVESIL